MTGGAYGLRLGGDAPRSSLLVDTPHDCPEITISRLVGTIALENQIDAEHATVPLLDGGGLQLDRVTRSAVVTTPHELTDDELAHPYLAPAAAVHSHWLGRAAFHAGSIVWADLAWGVIGERQDGKSTLLAAVNKAGGVVMADDLLVITPEGAYSGPRTLDLREEAADWFEGTRAIGVAGARRRWRLDLGAAPFVVPFGGWIVPRWGEDIAITVRRGAAAAHLIGPAKSVSGLAMHPASFLAAAAKPAIEFTRPRNMERLDAGIDALLESISQM